MKQYKKICFLGGGSWGQALSISLARAGYRSFICVSDKRREKVINKNKSSCFTDLKFPNLISAFTNLNKLKDYDLIFICTESFRVEDSIKKIMEFNPKSHVIITSKGFANENGVTFPQIINKVYPNLIFGILSGPTFAREVAENLPSAAIVASKNTNLSKNISELFSKTSLRLYISSDPIGVSIAGAIKNIIAIGSGISEGLRLGNNAKSALITRGIAELSRIIKASGGNKETAFGLAGIGDMTLTCGSSQSRNMKFGLDLATKNNNCKNKLVEGVHAIKAARNLSNNFNVDTPIINAINDIINNNKEIEDVISKLFNRPIKNETF